MLTFPNSCIAYDMFWNILNAIVVGGYNDVSNLSNLLFLTETNFRSQYGGLKPNFGIFYRKNR